MANDLYPSLKLPALQADQLRKGLDVQTRYFYADSLPGRRATVVRHWTTHNGTWVRCNYGRNLSGKSLLKTMPADTLALA